MARIIASSGIEQIHGKTYNRDRGYYYTRNGRQFYRERDEDYQNK